MENERKPPQRRLTTKEYIVKLLNTIAKWQKEGDTPEEAVARLSAKQYDFLIDHEVNLDNLLLTEKQLASVKAVVSAGRPKGLQYVKEYPQDKKDLYTSIVAHLQEQGATDIVENKNFRDLDFLVNGVKFKIVLSNPRESKNKN